MKNTIIRCATLSTGEYGLTRQIWGSSFKNG